jgi:hypothetical protein
MTFGWLHWLIPALLVVVGIATWSKASGDQGFLGTATAQSVGDVAVGFACWAMAAGYGLGRLVAWFQWRRRL